MLFLLVLMYGDVIYCMCQVKEAQRQRDSSERAMVLLRTERIEAGGVRVSLEGRISEHRQAFENLSLEVKSLREALSSKSSSTKAANKELQSKVQLLENKLGHSERTAQKARAAVVAVVKTAADEARIGLRLGLEAVEEANRSLPITPAQLKFDENEMSPVLATGSPVSFNMSHLEDR